METYTTQSRAQNTETYPEEPPSYESIDHTPLPQGISNVKIKSLRSFTWNKVGILFRIIIYNISKCFQQEETLEFQHSSGIFKTVHSNNQWL